MSTRRRFSKRSNSKNCHEVPEAKVCIYFFFCLNNFSVQIINKRKKIHLALNEKYANRKPRIPMLTEVIPLLILLFYIIHIFR